MSLMNLGCSRKSLIVMAAVLLLSAVPSLQLAAQPVADVDLYRIGSRDVLTLTVWQKTELDREMVVDEGGRLNVPLIGYVNVENRTLSEVQQEILEDIQIYHREVTRVSLEVKEYNSKAIFVLGSVSQPGKYALYPVPDVWSAIREAGGVSPQGDLSRVRITRLVNGERTVEIVNLQARITAGGTLEPIPLHPGDSVDVPPQPALAGAYIGRDSVYVLGEVLRPGIYRLEADNQDLLGLILQAGGPTDDADMDEVLLLRTRADGSLIRFELSISEYLDDADRTDNPKVLAGDTIYVTQSRQFSRLIRNNLAILTGLATLVTSIILINNSSN
ncbi:MAG: hypothetical protein GY835_04385 [bacterium]|nr:hypothetical protein [bacterium]